MGKRPRGRGFDPRQHLANLPPSPLFQTAGRMQAAMNFAANAPDLAKIERRVDAAAHAGWRIPKEWIEKIRAIAGQGTSAAFDELVNLYLEFATKVGFPQSWTATDSAAALFVIYNRIARGEPALPGMPPASTSPASEQDSHNP